MFLYSIARKVNGKLKEQRKIQAGRWLSPVRRIEFVHPPQNGRFCAMTFDDGPMALPPNPGNSEKGLTETLLDILGEYDAKGTFDVIGDTGENYPDEEGKKDDFSWSGVAYDHYPSFGKDKWGGAIYQGKTIERMIAEGHEISNHGYRHVLFGPMGFNYAKRKYFLNIKEVISDLQRLDNFLRSKYGYQMHLSRPPHYIDKTKDGYTSYDAYQTLGYQYLAASFDGAGWLPRSSDYGEYIEKTMVAPLRQALEADPDALNGKIIFQKDGYNMSLETPVADALPQQLKILEDYGYRVIPVSNLLQLSPFEDVAEDSVAFPHIQKMLKKGHTIAYKNNSFQGERSITYGEMLVMLCPPAIFRAFDGDGRNDIYQAAFHYFANRGMDILPGCSRNQLENHVSGKDLLTMALSHGIDVDETFFKDKAAVAREYAITLLSQVETDQF